MVTTVLAPRSLAGAPAWLWTRLLAVFRGGEWHQSAGAYKVMLGASSRDIRQTVTVKLPARRLPASFRP